LGSTPKLARPAGLTPNRAIGYRLAGQHGWTGKQWTCLERLWTGESGWNHKALNENTGNSQFDAGMVGKYGDAFGIPQSLPPNKMASAGRDWRTNPATQIRWGIDYIDGRYGTPCSALRKWKSRSPHWY
jgi:resuscitation-promoting factor RpfB